MPDIFISYSREDLTLSTALAHKLEALGWIVWWDHHIRAGADFDTAIEEKLAACKCLIVIWTDYSVKSRWVKAEATDALDKDKLIPIQVGDVKPPLIFRGVNNVRWNGNNTVEDEEMTQLLRHLKHVIGDPPVNSKTTIPVSGKTSPAPENHSSGTKPRSAEDPALTDLKNLFAQHQKEIGYYLEPDIPNDKVQNARKSCSIPYSEPILALLDLTIFGSASDCLAFTPRGIYHRWFEEFQSIPYTSLSAKSIRPSEVMKPGFWIDDLFLSLMSSGDQVKGVVKLLHKLAGTTASNLTSDAFLKILEKYEGMGDFHVHPLIPQGKLKNAIASCAIPKDEVLLALIDLTVFGAADDCLAFTATHLHYQNYLGNPKHALYTYVQLSRANIRIKRNDLMGKEILVDETMLNMSGTSAPLERIIELIRELAVGGRS